MKSKISILIAYTMFFIQPIAFSADCLPGYSYDVSLANQAFHANEAYCSDVAFPGPCKTEAEAQLNNALNNAYDGFQRCCCLNNLAYCCN
jgi:hypothetical protein